MKSIYSTIVILLFLNQQFIAQNIGINGSGANAHPSALLDIDATATPSLGLLIPRIVLQAINVAAPVISPATSLLVYNTASAGTGSNVVSAGYYYWDGTQWVRFAYNPSGTSSAAWNTLGNVGTIAGTNFLGTADAQDLVFRTNNTEKMRVMSNGNVGIGTNAPAADLHISRTNASTALLIENTSSTALVYPGVSILNYQGATTGHPYINMGNAKGTKTLPTAINNTTNLGALIYSGHNGTSFIQAARIEVCPDSVFTSNRAATYMSFSTGSSIISGSSYGEKMRITSIGNVGIGTSSPDASAKVDISSTTQGFAMPRMTTAQRIAIISPTEGLEVYDLNLHDYYYYNGTRWDNARMGAGTVNYFANTAPPVGYLTCNGQAVTTTTYPELFNAIGYTYGGSGTSFNVPDLRGEFIRGADMGRGVDGGRVLGSGQLATAVGGYIQSDLSIPPSGTYYDLILNPDGTQTVPGGVFINNSALSGNTGGAQNAYPADFTGNTYSKANTRPRNVALMPCIKY